MLNKDFEKCQSLIQNIGICFDVDEVDHVSDNLFHIELSTRSKDIDFDVLAKLSELFKTKLVNLGSETRDAGFCETCSYSYSVITVRIDNASM